MAPTTIGIRVRVLREARDMTRKQLGEAIGLTEDWVKKFEEGRRQADPRISTLRAIASALGVTLNDLLEEEPVHQTDDENTDTALLRAVLLAPMAGPTRRADLDEIWRECTHGFASYQAGRYGSLLDTLPAMIAKTRAMPDDPASARAAYRAHHLAAITLMKYEGGTAAWHAAERALDYATTSQDPIVKALAAQVLAYTMTTINEARTGMNSAINHAQELEGPLSDGSVPASTALGMLYLKGAVAAAECKDAESASEMLMLAERCAENVPVGTNFLSTGFDQLNVLLYRASIEAALARYAPAASAADQIGQDALRLLPRERRTHHLIETADTYTRLRRSDDALSALLQAEHDNPREIYKRPAAREVIKRLLLVPGPVPERLEALAQRAGVKA
jgi:transcriptional regulator with XRE-family HTH domain